MLEISIQSSDRKVVALHFGSDRKVALSILLKVSEVSHRCTTGSKQRVVIRMVTTHQCDDFPFLLFDVRKPAGVVNDACTIAVLACSKTLRLKPLIGFKN